MSVEVPFSLKEKDRYQEGRDTTEGLIFGNILTLPLEMSSGGLGYMPVGCWDYYRKGQMEGFHGEGFEVSKTPSRQKKLE